MDKMKAMSMHVNKARHRWTSVPTSTNPLILCGWLMLIMIGAIGWQTTIAGELSAEKAHESPKALNDSEAQYQLGMSLLKGNPDAPQHERARHHFSVAASTGHASAQYELGMMILNGQTPYQNADVALDWLSRAALQGHSKAMLEAGKLYETNTGLSRNKIKAYVWYALANEKGISEGLGSKERVWKSMNFNDRQRAQIKLLKVKKQLQ